MATIFINYRRSDAEAHAGRLYDSLMIQLAGAKIFMDVDSLEAGENFVETLKATLWSADLMLVVVGRTWSTAADATGMRRLDNADDFVRLEIANALNRQMHIIPVLVQSASMPSIHELPDEIKDLAHRQAIEIRHNRWTDDVSHLVDRIESLLNSSTEAGLIRHDTSSVKGTRGARVRRAWTRLLRKIGLGSERSAFRRRNRRHYHLYRAGTIAVVVLVIFAGYQWYRYARRRMNAQRAHLPIAFDMKIRRRRFWLQCWRCGMRSCERTTPPLLKPR